MRKPIDISRMPGYNPAVSNGATSVSDGLVRFESPLGLKVKYPHCLRHGAMLMVSPDGIWRCGELGCDVGCYFLRSTGSSNYTRNTLSLLYRRESITHKARACERDAHMRTRTREIPDRSDQLQWPKWAGEKTKDAWREFLLYRTNERGQKPYVSLLAEQRQLTAASKFFPSGPAFKAGLAHTMMRQWLFPVTPSDYKYPPFDPATGELIEQSAAADPDFKPESGATYELRGGKYVKVG